MSVAHASVELLEAMRGKAPPRTMTIPPPLREAACGHIRQPSEGTPTLAWNGDDASRCYEDRREVTCPACIALYPPEIRVRMDWVESGRPKLTG